MSWSTSTKTICQNKLNIEANRRKKRYFLRQTAEKLKEKKNENSKALSLFPPFSFGIDTSKIFVITCARNVHQETWTKFGKWVRILDMWKDELLALANPSVRNFPFQLCLPQIWVHILGRQKALSLPSRLCSWQRGVSELNFRVRLAILQAGIPPAAFSVTQGDVFWGFLSTVKAICIYHKNLGQRATIHLLLIKFWTLLGSVGSSWTLTWSTH